MNEDHKLISK